MTPESHAGAAWGPEAEPTSEALAFLARSGVSQHLDCDPPDPRAWNAIARALDSFAAAARLEAREEALGEAIGVVAESGALCATWCAPGCEHGSISAKDFAAKHGDVGLAAAIRALGERPPAPRETLRSEGDGA